jgi:hypothetical protein
MRDAWRTDGDRSPHPDDGDDGLLDALRGAVAAAEPMPCGVRDGGRMAFSLRGLPVLPSPAGRSRPATARGRLDR